jgi:uncharacterized protein (TIGR02217 family)
VSAFHDIRLPLRLARGAMGGPERITEVVPLANGREMRISALSASRRRWDLASAVRSLDDLALVTAFFEARLGRLHAFRFRDPMDFKSCPPSGTPGASDQILGTGDGSRISFQLIKLYGDAAGSFQRPIRLPVAGSVTVSVDGSPLTAGQYSVDGLTGLVTLSAAPLAGAVVRAGFLFDVPVRFDTDRLDLALDAFEAGRLVSVPLVEVVL